MNYPGGLSAILCKGGMDWQEFLIRYRERIGNSGKFLEPALHFDFVSLTGLSQKKIYKVNL